MKFTLNKDLKPSELFHLAAFGIPKDFKDSLYVETSIYGPMFIKAYVKISKSYPEIISSTTTCRSRMLVTSTKPQKIARDIWENVLAGDLRKLANVIDFSTIGHCTNSFAPQIPERDSWKPLREVLTRHGAVIMGNSLLVREPDHQKLNALAVSVAAKVKFMTGDNLIIHFENPPEKSYMEILTYA